MNDILTPQDKPAFERIEKFQSLSAGQYWRALEDVPKYAIKKDMVLLIQSIAWVDHQPHTLSLRAHPDQYGQYKEVEWIDEKGEIRTGRITCQTHDFRLSTFLQSFEFEPGHEQIRQRELTVAQGRVFALQQDLVDTQSSPEKMAAVIAAGFEEIDRKTPRATEAQDRLPVVVDSSAPVPQNLSSFLASGITESSIAVIKAQAERSHTIATIQGNWITSKTKEIEQAIKRMTPYFDEYGAAALAHTEEVRVYVDKIMTGIQSLDLYIGKGVEVTALRKGQSACPLLPLTVMQSKLVMVEEISVFTHVDETTDHQSFNGMASLLESNPAFVEQIFPTERCIVCMCSTRRDLHYENAFEGYQRNQTNRAVFLLVRDGENIYCVDSPVTTHLGASRLFPSKGESDAIFTGVGGEQITFDSLKYTKSLSAFEAAALHYKRFLILLAGLDHRLRLFGDFYTEPQGLDFVSLSFQEKYLRFIHDDDGESMLPRERVQHVSEWIKEMNSYLSPGSRVYCLWWRLKGEETSPGLMHFKADPVHSSGVALAYADGSAICVDVDARRSRWHDNKTVFQSKVYLTQAVNLSHGTEPFLVLDAVNQEQLRRYIFNRRSRVHSVEYIELFKQALKFTEQERVHEAPMRERLQQALLEGGITEAHEAEELVNKAVIRWRAANKGATLPRFQGSTPPAEWTVMLDLLFMLQHGLGSRLSAIEAFAHERRFEPLRLVLTGKSQLVLYASPSAAERDDRVSPFVWVHRIVLRLGKRAIGEASRKWVIFQEKSAAEVVQHEWSEAKQWLGQRSPFKSPQAKVEIFNQLTLNADRFKTLLSDQGTLSEFAEAWRREHYRSNAGKQRLITRPSFFIPIGLVGYKSNLSYVGFGCNNAAHFLASCHPTEQLWADISEEYLRWNRSPDIARELERHRSGRPDLGALQLRVLPISAYPNGAVPLFFGRDTGEASQHLQLEVENTLSFDHRFSALKARDGSGKSRLVWIAPQLRSRGETGDVTSTLSVDRWLGIEEFIATVSVKTIVTVTFSADDNKFPYQKVIWALDGPATLQPLHDFKGWNSASTGYESFNYQEEFDAALKNLHQHAIPMDEAPDQLPQPFRPVNLIACLYVPV